MQYFSETERQAEFNSNFAIIKRLNDELTDCNEYSSMARDETSYYPKYINMWRSKIINIYKEVDSKMSESERTEINRIIRLFKKVQPMLMIRNTPDGPQTYVNPKSCSTFINLCHHLEILLRRVVDKKGLGMTDKESASDAIYH